MNVKKFLVLFGVIIIHFTSFLFSENLVIPEVVSSTFFTQDLSKPSPDVVVFTSKDIKALGVSNIPDLLKLINSLNVYTINESTADISLRGFPSLFKLNPLILIDGMEISENVYDRTYLYNLPVDIHEIDRVEVLRNTSITIDGISNQFGVINIVTKSPEVLENNYVYVQGGSKAYKKTGFSINKYIKGIYSKLNGFTRRIAQNDEDFKMTDSSLLELELSKYLSNSRIFLKSTFMEEDLNFKEKIGIKKPDLKSCYLVQFWNSLKDIKHFNNILNYKSKNFDFSIYYQTYFGKVYLKIPGDERYHSVNDKFSKISIRRKFLLKRNKILLGFEGRYRYVYMEKFGNMKRTSGNIFIQDDINIFKNFKVNLYLNWDRTKDLGDKITYKLNFIYSKPKSSFYARIGFSKDYRKPFMGYQYVKYDVIATNQSFPELNKYNLDHILVKYNNNKSLSSYKIRTTEFVLSKKIKNLKFDFTVFYNNIYDIPSFVGKLNLFPLFISITPKKIRNVCSYGFDYNLTYQLNHVKFFISFYHQRIKDKLKDNFIRISPQKKITSGFLFFNKTYSGSITSRYVSSYINSKKSTDTYTVFDVSLSKKSLKNRLDATIKINNVFNNKHIEGVFGDRIGRTFEIELKYVF